MTMDEIRKSEKDFLIPADIAEVVRCDPQAIREDAKNGTLQFPYLRSGSRTKIPRLAFIAWMEGRLGGNKNAAPLA